MGEIVKKHVTMEAFCTILETGDPENGLAVEKFLYDFLAKMCVDMFGTEDTDKVEVKEE